MLKIEKIMGITKKKNGVKVPNAIEIITAEKTVWVFSGVFLRVFVVSL